MEKKGPRPNLRNAIFPERGNLEGFSNVTAAIKQDIEERVAFLWAIRSTAYAQRVKAFDPRVMFGFADNTEWALPFSDHAGDA